MLTFSWLSLVTLGLMLVVAASVYGLLASLPKNATAVRELSLIAVPMLAIAAVIVTVDAIDAHREGRERIEMRETAHRHAQERIRNEAVRNNDALPFVRDVDGVLVLSRPAELARDYRLMTPEDAGPLRFRLDTQQFEPDDIVSLRNPRTLEWTTLVSGSVATLNAAPGDVLLVAVEKKPVIVTKPVMMAVPIRMEKLEPAKEGEE